MKQLPLSRSSEIIVNELKDELLIYDLTIDKAYCLNKISMLVWNLCDGNTSISDISHQLSKKLKQTVSEDFVYLALQELKKNNLLDDSSEIINKFDGLSRREVIRRVGLASMVTLPVISSLVAPTAAMAQSAGGGGFAPNSRALGQTCTASPQCTSGAPNCNSGHCCVGGGSSPSQTLVLSTPFCGGPTPNASCCSGQQMCAPGAIVCS